MTPPAPEEPPVLGYDASGVRRRLALRRIIGTIVAALLFVATLYFGVHAWRYHHTLRAQMAARPLSMEIDFSEPGVVESPLIIASPTLHGLSIHVKGSRVQPDPGQLLNDLKGTLQTIDPQTGSVVHESEFPQENTPYRDSDSGDVLLGFARTGGPGTYTARVTIHTPAKTAPGTKLTLYVRNEFCIAETLPDFLGKAFTGTSLALFVVIGGLTFRSVRRNGWWRAPPGT